MNSETYVILVPGPREDGLYSVALHPSVAPSLTRSQWQEAVAEEAVTRVYGTNPLFALRKAEELCKHEGYGIAHLSYESISEEDTAPETTDDAGDFSKDDQL